LPGKNSLHHYTTATSLYQAGWVHGRVLLTPNPDSAISMTQQEPGFVGPGNVFPLLNCPVLVIACPLEPLLVFRQGSTSCTFRDAVRHTTVVRHYLSVCGPPVSLHDSCHSTSLINELFSHTGLPLTGCFLFVALFPVNPRHCHP
jgi:hypothetical protein